MHKKASTGITPVEAMFLVDSFIYAAVGALSSIVLSKNVALPSLQMLHVSQRPRGLRISEFSPTEIVTIP